MPGDKCTQNPGRRHQERLQSTAGLVIFAALSSLPPPTHPQPFVDQTVRICPAHPDGRTCTHRRAHLQMCMHRSLAPRSQGASTRRGGVASREWAGSREEELRGLPVPRGSHVPAGRYSLCLPRCALDPK